MSLDWLIQQLESLLPSHPLRFLVLDIPRSFFISRTPWVRLDEVIHTKQHIQLIVNQPSQLDSVERRRNISWAFQRLDQAGSISFGKLDN